MSTRKTVIDQIVTELQTISGIGMVTLDAQAWTETEPKNFPALYVDNPEVQRSRLSFNHPSTAVPDREAVMSVEVRGRTFDFAESTQLKADLDSLLDNVETTLVGSTALAALVKDVMPTDDEPDLEVNESYGTFLARYEVTYQYHHSNP